MDGMDDLWMGRMPAFLVNLNWSCGRLIMCVCMGVVISLKPLYEMDIGTSNKQVRSLCWSWSCGFLEFWSVFCALNSQ